MEAQVLMSKIRKIAGASEKRKRLLEAVGVVNQRKAAAQMTLRPGF
jgi:hypothetical protein